MYVHFFRTCEAIYIVTLSLVSPDAEKVNYRLPGFLSKFLELQQVMWTTNQGLTERHTYDSRPDAWPRLRRGIVCGLTRWNKYALIRLIFAEFLG